MQVLKYGKTSHMMQNLMFGHWDAFFLSLFISNRPLGPGTSNLSVKRSIMDILER